MTIQRISAKEAAEYMERGYTFVDVRSVPEFEQGHPPGAWNIPLLHAGPRGMMPNEEFVDVIEKVLPKNAKIVLGCASGPRSLHAAQMLAEEGWTDLAELRPGFMGARDPMTGMVVEAGWAGAGLPVEQGSPAGQSYKDLSSR